MNAIEAAWERLLAAFEAEVACPYLSNETEHQLAMLRVHDHQSAVTISALLEECDELGERLGYECEPCVQEVELAA
jgi:hypothetical protein